MTRSQGEAGQRGRPKGSKNKPKDAATTPAAASASHKKRAAPAPAAPQPAAAAPAAPVAAAAAGDGSPQQSTSELETQRRRLANELSAVEARIYHLETQYLENSSPFGNAIRGYEGFLGGAAASRRAVGVKPEERLFSWSSVTGQVPAAQR